MKIIEDTKLATKMMNNLISESDLKDSSFRQFFRIYPFTTENIKGYFEKINFNEKDILTVCGSGDHILNSILLGANNIDAFDINPLTIHYFNLKKAAIESLTYGEYLEFFFYFDFPNIGIKNPNVFNEKSFSKIIKNLKGENKYFWKYLFLKYDGIKIRERLFFKDGSIPKVTIYINPYLDKNNYYLLKEKIKPHSVKFYNVNLKDLPNYLNQNYDLVFLSNISNYLHLIFDSDYLENYKEIILKLNNNLNKDGLIYLIYLYSISLFETSYIEDLSEVYNHNKRNKVFNSEHYSKIIFESYRNLINNSNNSTNVDCTLIYKNNNKKYDIIK